MLHKRKVSGGFYKKDAVVYTVYLRTQNGAYLTLSGTCVQQIELMTSF